MGWELQMNAEVRCGFDRLQPSLYKAFPFGNKIKLKNIIIYYLPVR